jgi:hypothetical protein
MAQEHVNPANIQSLPGGSRGSPFLTRSCHACNRRKVRCNKVFPCDNCVRLGVECTFPPPGRKPRKRPAKSNKAELISRLSLLEREVEKLGAQDVVGAAPADGQENGIPDLQHRFGRLVIDRNHGTSRYVNHRVLTDLGDQVNHVPSYHPKHESEGMRKLPSCLNWTRLNDWYRSRNFETFLNLPRHRSHRPRKITHCLSQLHRIRKPTALSSLATTRWLILYKAIIHRRPLAIYSWVSLKKMSHQ